MHNGKKRTVKNRYTIDLREVEARFLAGVSFDHVEHQ